MTSKMNVLRCPLSVLVLMLCCSGLVLSSDWTSDHSTTPATTQSDLKTTTHIHTTTYLPTTQTGSETTTQFTTTQAVTTSAPTIQASTTLASTTQASTTQAFTTQASTTQASTTQASTTQASTTQTIVSETTTTLPLAYQDDTTVNPTTVPPTTSASSDSPKNYNVHVLKSGIVVKKPTTPATILWRSAKPSRASAYHPLMSHLHLKLVPQVFNCSCFISYSDKGTKYFADKFTMYSYKANWYSYASMEKRCEKICESQSYELSLTRNFDTQTVLSDASESIGEHICKDNMFLSSPIHVYYQINVESSPTQSIIEATPVKTSKNLRCMFYKFVS